MRTKLSSCLLYAAAAASLCGCSDGAAWKGPLPAADYAQFERDVYPVLLRDCAFSTCHGAEHRFFHLYGPGRTRLDPSADPASPATAAEVMHSYTRAVSMIATDARVERSLLLTKPIELSADGAGHKGVDSLGRNVYRSKQDAGYVAIARWASAAASAARAGGGP